MIDDTDFAEVEIDLETQQMGTGAVSVAETFDTRSDDGSVDRAPIGVPPPSNVSDNLVSGYVPPPPQDFEPINLDTQLARELTPGRFSVRCLQGHDIRRKDDMSANPRTDPYIKFKMGAAERFPWYQTSVRRKQDQHPEFGGEVVSFNVVNPAQYVLMDDVQLTVEVWNKSAFKDELMGAVTMSIVRILKSPFLLFKESVPLFLPGSKTSSSKLSLEFVFEEARCGMFVITLFEAHGLRSLDPMGQQHPFINFNVGPKYNKKSKVVKNGGTSPYFQEEEILIWADSENWVHDLKFDVCDELIGVEHPIGGSFVSMLPYMNLLPDDAKTEDYDLFYLVKDSKREDAEIKEVACGMLTMRIRFLQAGKLTVYCTKGRNLQYPESHKASSDQRIDPYCSLTLDGQAVKMVKRTPADKDGGHDPVWEHNIRFDLVDQYLLDLDVFHQNISGQDVLLGYTQISLLPIFRNGKSEFWVTLKQQKLSGGIIEMGAVHLVIMFSALPGIKYPQLRPGVDTFDDTVRKTSAAIVDKEEDDRIEVKPEISTIPEAPAPVSHKKHPHATDDGPGSPEKSSKPTESALAIANDEKAEQEFTDEEIIAAFKFIDLDHNNFVGAAEIRHILICMGEMITGIALPNIVLTLLYCTYV